MGSSAVGLALCMGVWWAAMGDAWGEEHYEKLWEHDSNINPTPITYDKIPPDRSSESEITQRRNYNKKNYRPTERTPEITKQLCKNIVENMRFDCFPRGVPNKHDCLGRGCCWNSVTSTNEHNRIPYCFYPSHYNTYRFHNMTEDKHSTTVFYEKDHMSGYPEDFEIPRIDFTYMSDDVMQIKIYDAEHKRFEPPYPEISMVPKPLSKMKYRVQIPEDVSRIGFKVIRNSDNVTIFDTENIGGFILSDRLLQMSALLPTDHIFGLGERRGRFMIDMNWHIFPMYNRDRKPVENANLYGTHPFYMGIEKSGIAHGVLLINSSPMDIAVQPTPALTIRAMGGVLRLLLLAGEKPSDVLAQLTSVLGRPTLPPYWALGFHLCRFNYLTVNATRDVWKKNRDAEIPFDVQWNDIDYMNERKDFTYDEERFAGLPQFVDEIHKEGMHYVMIIDPGIYASEKPGTYKPYERGTKMDIFIKNNKDQPILGKVWNDGYTVYPDFSHPNSTAYWVEMLSDYHEKVKYDGVCIDMNEPSNFVNDTESDSCELDYTPYRLHTPEPCLAAHSLCLDAHSLCLDARHYAGVHQDLHNLYGLMEAVATHNALTEIRGKRPFIISRSSFVGLGKFAGHWSGNIDSAWHDMRMTIPELLNFAIFGIPMMGADICGYAGDASPALCRRWMQLGAFYPFSRNNNDNTSKPQDPVSMGPEVVSASRASLRLRYRLLPVYYTQFWRAHVYGDSVVRPLFFETPENTAVHDIDDQFLVGPYVMVTPILQEGATYATPYFPGPQPWYNIIDGTFLANNATRNISEDETVSVKGGAILPLQEPPQRGPVTTTNTRSSPMQLFVVPSVNHTAYGELYWDDGDSLNTYDEEKFSHIEFYLNHTQLHSVVDWWGYGVPLLNNITIVAQSTVTGVVLNGHLCEKPHCQYTYLPKTKVLHIHNINLPLDKPFILQWSG